MFSKNDAKLLEALKLNRDQMTFIEYLVGFSKAETDAEKSAFADQLQTLSENTIHFPKISEIPSDKYDLYAQWHHQVIRSLIELYDFAGNYEWLAQKVFPTISVEEAKESVELLLRLELVEKDEQGIFRAVEKHISTGAAIQKTALREYYEKTVDLGIQSLSTVKKDKRNVSGVILGISDKTYQEIIERIAQLRKELIELADNDDEADRVYNLTMLCFPVSTNDEV